MLGAGAGALGLFLVLASCAPEPQLPPPLFSGIPGASVGGRQVGASRAESGLLKLPEVPRLDEDEEGEIIAINSRTVGDLMANLIYVIENDEPDMFVDWLLSEITSREFAERGLDPATAFEELVKHEKDIRKLFTRLPAGEYTPGVFMQPQGSGVFRLAIRRDRDFYWNGMDVRFEDLNWKLRWFVP